MSNQITLKKLEDNLTFFNKMYDAVRIVDPVCKKVLESSGNSVIETDEICYKYWENDKICDNCISVRAYLENKSYVKLEHNTDTIMLVTAIPIENAETPTVLELLKNATDSLMVGTGDYNEGVMMRKKVAELNEMVIKDSLTTLYNRRYIDERLPVDIVKSTINEWPLSVIFMDMDNLKIINDAYGHNIGDLMLKEVGHTIQNCIRTDNDWSARYGGDEFLICLNNTGYHEAFIIAERIRDSIEKIYVPVENTCINLTVSMGIHTMTETKITADELISYADNNMYEAKRRGKNQIVSDC